MNLLFSFVHAGVYEVILVVFGDCNSQGSLHRSLSNLQSLRSLPVAKVRTKQQLPFVHLLTKINNIFSIFCIKLDHIMTVDFL